MPLLLAGNASARRSTPCLRLLRGGSWVAISHLQVALAYHWGLTWFVVEADLSGFEPPIPGISTHRSLLKFRGHGR